MDIVKKLNPFKRVQTPVRLPYDSDASGRRGLGHQTQSTAHHAAPRSVFGRDSERKRNARAAATEKELLHLNHKIVSKSLHEVTHALDLYSALLSMHADKQGVDIVYCF